MKRQPAWALVVVAALVLVGGMLVGADGDTLLIATVVLAGLAFVVELASLVTKRGSEVPGWRIALVLFASVGLAAGAFLWSLRGLDRIGKMQLNDTMFAPTHTRSHR
jgi:hypothetical protein